MSLIDSTAQYERSEPYFEVVTALGDVFTFRNPSSRSEFESLRTGAADFARVVREGSAGSALREFIGSDVNLIAACFMMHALFIRAKIGEADIDSISQAEWLEFANVRWQLFNTIREGLEEQVNVQGALIRRKSLEEAKKNSETTHLQQPNSEQPSKSGDGTPQS